MALTRFSTSGSSKRRIRKIVFTAVMLVLAALSWYPGGATMSGALDRVLFDTVTRLFAHPASNKVVVVNIDEPSMREIGAAGLADSYAPLITRLHDAGSVALDLMITPRTDTIDLTDAMAKHGRVVLLGSAGTDGVGIDLKTPLQAELKKNAAAVGHGEVTMGHYGVVSGFIPNHANGSTLERHIALEAVRVGGEVLPSGMLESYLRPYAQSVSQHMTNAVLLMLRGVADIPQYSYADVVRGRIPSSSLAGKIVFVGHSVWRGQGVFQTSSLDAQTVSRAQLDALIAESLVSGNLAREVPGIVAVPFYVAMALVMVLICSFTQGRRMHAAAVAWGALLFAIPIGLLALFHYCLSIGLLPIVCVLIYAFHAWDRLARMVDVLRREIRKLRAISTAIGATEPAASDWISGLETGDSLNDVKTAMREIRSWQKMYVNLINRLPCPVFLAVNDRVTVCNAKAAALMAGWDSSAGADSPNPVASPMLRIERLVSEYSVATESTSHEVDLDGREHILLCVPYMSFSPAAAEERVLRLICLVDISDVKDGVMHDRLMLRHVAHDLRSPLTTMLALIEERAAESQESVPQSDQQFLADLRRQADYSLRVAKDFMQLSRAEQLDRDAFSPITLYDVAVEAMDQVWSTAERKSVQLIGPIGQIADTLVMASSDMLIRAVVNVLDNAVKYSPSHTSIRIGISRAGPASFELYVIDEGIGISGEAMTRIFEPFFQVETHRDVADGLGLGLAFVKAVIQRHGGSLSVTSESGMGTEFRIVLPAFTAGVFGVEPDAGIVTSQAVPCL
jgi:CHASE2 domain-containing sensor protein/nitrogen-specific signal transduction histidine kinase